MDKIAIISDIHSNLEALKEVLKDINKRGIKKIYCLGDIIAKGVNPSECVALIKENCDIVLQGNCDEFFSRDFSNNEIKNYKYSRIEWNQSMLSLDELKYLRDLPFCHEFYMSGSLIRLFHSSPSKIDNLISNLDSIDKKYSMLLPSKYTNSQNIADVVIYGHLHTQYLDKIYNKTLVNAGSVGNPINLIRNDKKDSKNIETTRANYLIIEGNLDNKNYDDSLSFQFIAVPYNIKKELSSNKFNIEKESYEAELIQGKYRDTDKLYPYFNERGIDITKI